MTSLLLLLLPLPPFNVSEIPSKPLEILHIDIYTINHNLYLAIIDKFLKFAQEYVLTNRSSINVITALKTFFSQFGIPNKIVYDQGAEFAGVIFQDFLSQYNVTPHITSFQQISSNYPGYTRLSRRYIE